LTHTERKTKWENYKLNSFRQLVTLVNNTNVMQASFLAHEMTFTGMHGTTQYVNKLMLT